MEQERNPAHEDAGYQRQAGHPADGAVAAATARLGPGEPTAVRILGRWIHVGPSFYQNG